MLHKDEEDTLCLTQRHSPVHVLATQNKHNAKRRYEWLKKKTPKKIHVKCEACYKGLNKCRAIKAKVEVEVQFHTLSPSALDRGVLSFMTFATSPHEKQIPMYTQGCPTAGLDTEQKRKISCLAQNQTTISCHPDCGIVSILSFPGSYKVLQWRIKT